MMQIRDSVLKQYLRNVYFVSGTACGGKTTVTRILGRDHGIAVYDNDEEFERHQSMADPADHPNMLKKFADADEFFDRTVEEYRNWLLGNLREQLDFMVLDLIEMSKDRKIICDCNITVQEAEMLTDPSRIVFLIKEPGDIVEEYCEREDHRPFRDWIRSASDYEHAKQVCGDTLRSINGECYEEIRKSGYFFLDRADGRTVEETVAEVEGHFGFDSPVTVRRVEKGSHLASELLEFVENCSWTEAKDHIAELIRNWEFTDWETMFAAEKYGKIVGMASAMKKDYYPIDDICPWVSCIYVDEQYRGKEISGELIEAANRYLMELGFRKSYIPSHTAGLYEKYGYTYLGDIVNYGGETDRLYFKDLN